MAFSCRQLTLVASTPTPCLVQGSTGTKFPNITGQVGDPIPCTIKNEQADTTVVYVGGPDVSATKGQSIAPGNSQTYNLYSVSDIPYVFSTGTPVVSVLVARQ
jgi:hypothetical protein